jgi:RNA polymerase sigma factor (sigma-70 family)
MSCLTDEQLIARYLKNNDEQALEDLIRRYLPLIFTFVCNYIGDRENAADVTQEVFVKTWKNLKKFNPKKAFFRAWIFTIARRTAIDWLKKKNALPFSAIQSEIGDNNFANSLADESRTKPRGLAARLCFVRDESPSITEQLMLRETSKKLSLALAQLPGDYSAVINLHINEDLSFREIAGRLKKPLNTVKSQYRRALAMLKSFFSQSER